MLDYIILCVRMTVSRTQYKLTVAVNFSSICCFLRCLDVFWVLNLLNSYNKMYLGGESVGKRVGKHLWRCGRGYIPCPMHFFHLTVPVLYPFTINW